MPAGILRRFEYMGECLACTPVAHPQTEPPDLYLILHRGDHRCAARSPAGGIVLRLTPLRSATVPQIASSSPPAPAIPASASTTAHPAAGRARHCFPPCWSWLPFVVLNVGINPAAKTIL